MNYQCGHKGCDVCGARTCTGTHLEKVGKYEVCESCIELSVRTTVHLCETLGGTIIDPAKPCGRPKRTAEIPP